MSRYIVYTKEKGKIKTDILGDFFGLTLHRLDGSAFLEFYDGRQLQYEWYYINGKCYNKSDYDAEIFKMKLALL